MARWAGVSVDEYVERRDAGQHFCTCCKTWKDRDDFGNDQSRTDGVDRGCKTCRSVRGKAAYTPVPVTPLYGKNSKTGRSGPERTATRGGDKGQARHRVHQVFKLGEIPPPRDLPCVDCGHAWRAKGDRRHEYDHHMGYGAEHQLSVQAVCTRCHHQRDNAKARQAACIRGHTFTIENTGHKPNGTRFCRECRRAFDRTRKRPDGYWKAVNARRYPDGRR